MDLREYIVEYNKVWKYLKAKAHPDGITELATRRFYTQQPILDTLDKLEMVYLDRKTFVPPPYEKIDPSLGLFTDPVKTGKEPFFLLTGRFVFPIKDISGNVIALVGWAKDELKYITTSSDHFSKATMFFGLENLMKPRSNGMGTWVVEGIFDRVAVESLGGRGFSTMGINTDVRKNALYTMMGRVVGVPDNDTEGRKVIKNDAWRLPIGSSYFRWKGDFVAQGIDGKDVKMRVKDIDDLVKYYDVYDLKMLFSDVYKEKTLRRITRLI